MKTLLLLKHNKVTDDAFHQFSKSTDKFQIKWGDFHEVVVPQEFIGNEWANTLDYARVAKYLESRRPFDAIMMGDVFWPSQQHVCRWGTKNKVKTFFLQHGQWIYVDNKRNPEWLPDCTFVYGDSLVSEINRWPYGKRSSAIATGNPRYDSAKSTGHESIYYSPPIVFEPTIHGAVYCDFGYRCSKVLSRILKNFDILIHPHYREGAVDQLRDMFPNCVFADQADDPLLLIAKSSAVLTHRNSTVVLDAIAHGKQVILANFKNDDHSHYKRGFFGRFAKESKNLQDCAEHLEQIKRTEIDEEYINDAKPYLYLGNASDRITGIIEHEFSRHDGM